MDKVAGKIEKFFVKCIPDAFPLSLILMLITMLLAKAVTHTSIPEILGITASGMVDAYDIAIPFVITESAVYRNGH